MKYFSIYLLYLLLIIGFFIILFYIISAKLNKNKETKNDNKKVEGGSTSIFFDKDENAIFLPYANDIRGVGRAVDGPVFIKSKADEQILGQALRKVMEMSMANKPLSNQDLMDRLKYKGWKEFSSGKRNVSVHFKMNKGLIFNSTIRRSDGAYKFNNAGYEKILADDASDSEMGKTILIILKRCR